MMSTDLEIMIRTNTLNYGGKTITFFKDAHNRIWFVANDITRSLNYLRSKSAIDRHVDDEDKLPFDLLEPIISFPKSNYIYYSIRGNTLMINEYGLYCLIFGCRLVEADKFKRWISNQVIPLIRNLKLNSSIIVISDKESDTESENQNNQSQISGETSGTLKLKIRLPKTRSKHNNSEPVPSTSGVNDRKRQKIIKCEEEGSESPSNVDDEVEILEGSDEEYFPFTVRKRDKRMKRKNKKIRKNSETLFRGKYTDKKKRRLRSRDKIRFEVGGHWPIRKNKMSKRCKNKHCHEKTDYICVKCDKFLCPECFENYHTYF